MTVISTPSGFMSVRNTRPGDKVVRRSGGGSSGGMSTKESPTPSAGQLFGTAAQREQQIAIFRSGGQLAFQVSVTKAKEAARKRQEAIKQRQIDLNKKRLLELEKKRQQYRENVASGKISGQQSAQGKPSSYGAYNPTATALGIGTNVIKPAPKYSKELVKKAGREFFFLGGTPISAVGTLASPLQGLFKRRQGDVEFQLGATYGTRQDSALTPSLSGQSQTTTQFEIQRQQALVDPSLLLPPEEKARRISQNISAGITPALQGQVSEGKITVAEAEKQYDVLFETEVSKPKYQSDLKKSAKFKQSVASGYKPSFDVVQASETAVTFAGMATPVGSVLVGSSFVASGLPKVTGGDTWKERGLGLFEVGAGLGIGGLGVKQVERAADKLLVSEILGKKRYVAGEEIYSTSGGSLFKIKSKAKFGTEASVESNLLAPAFKTGDKTFSITGGRGTARLQYFSVEKGKDVVIKENILFGGRGTVAEGIPLRSRGGFKIGVEDSFGSFGEGYVKKRGSETFRNIKFGGMSKDVETPLGSFTTVKSGRLTKLRLGGVTPLFRKGTAFKSIKGIYTVEEEGVIKRLVQVQEDTGIHILSPSKSMKRTPLSSTFGTGQATQQGVIQKTSPSIISPTPTGVSSAIEKQIFAPQRTITNVGRSGGTTTTSTILEQKSTPITKTKQIPVTSSVFVQRSQVRSRSILGTSSLLMPLTKTTQAQMPFQAVAIAQTYKTPQKLKTVQITSPIIPFGMLVKPTGSFYGGGVGGFGFPRFPSFTPRVTKRKPQRGRSPTRYQPSFTSSILNIRGKAKKYAGGLSIRPLLLESDLLRKKKKKRVVRRRVVRRRR